MTGDAGSRSSRRAVLATGLAAIAVVALAIVVVAGMDPGLLTAAASGSPAVLPSATSGELASEDADSAAPTASPIVPGSPSAGPSASPAATPPGTFPPLAAGVVPILYLHRVEAPPAEWPTWTSAQRQHFLEYDVIPAAFAADLDWLQANGYTTILPRDLAAHWDRGIRLPRRPVIISLDDGSPTWITTVLPMLRARGMVAEFYLTLDAVARGSISWSEVRRLASAGMGIGAHDVHHVQLAGLGPSASPASPDEMWFEVNEARAVIGAQVGTFPDSMAYVGGGFDATLVALVERAGYTTARSIIRGTHQSESRRYALRVVALRPGDDVIDPFTGELVPGLPVFAAKLSGQDT